MSTIKQEMPTQLSKDGKQYGEGYCTPRSMDTEQRFSFLPERVIPVIFLPGIMGSHLRINNAERQSRLGQKEDIAWRPDSLAWAWSMRDKDADIRQLLLDPETTVVDVYDPRPPPLGKGKQAADHRHNNADLRADTPLLRPDPVTAAKPRSAAQKARERGWSEVYFSSYGKFLNKVETLLNLAFVDGKLNRDWKDIIDTDPAQWQAVPETRLPPLAEAELKQVMTNCFYPVHAFGYNWLESNGVSARKLAVRINRLMEEYREKKRQCDKVILVTHSMGGLVARALCHPAYGIGLECDAILGIVHGVMPAIGAGAGYRRMRAGFEGGGIVNQVLGDSGPRVTAVLANSPGGLQLLPSQAYGNGWLRIVSEGGTVLKSLPAKGDPYKEIYEEAEVWWGLLRKEWINPARLNTSSLDATKELLNQAKEFHNNINGTYHPNSFAHYGCDPKHPAFQQVTWEVPNGLTTAHIDKLQVSRDSSRGDIDLVKRLDPAETPMPRDVEAHPRELGDSYRARLLPATDPGDETVPVYSADHQFHSGRFKAIFRQTGYEHQDSFKHERAVNSTLYSVIRIAQQMT